MTPTDTAKRTNSPPLKGRGKGWGLSANTITELQNRARQMRNNPTEPEKRLWWKLSKAQLNGYKFRRQQVIGYYITDFVCPSAKLVIEVDGHTHEPDYDARRDAVLAVQGYRVMRFHNDEVMRNLDGIVLTIAAALENADVGLAARPHPNPSPEGAGLLEAS